MITGELADKDAGMQLARVDKKWSNQPIGSYALAFKHPSRHCKAAGNV